MCINATCLVSNILSFVVVYIVVFGRSIPIKNYLPHLSFLIACLVCPLPGWLLFLRLQLASKGSNAMEDFALVNGLASAIHGIMLVSVSLNVAALFVVLSFKARTARTKGNSPSILFASVKGLTVSVAGLGSALRGGTGSSTSPAKKKNVIDELIARLFVYPAIHVLTQFLAAFDIYYYQPKTRVVSQSLTVSDDSFYKTRDYKIFWMASSVLVPSAGIAFFLAYAVQSPDMKKVIKKRGGQLSEYLRNASPLRPVSGRVVQTSSASFSANTYNYETRETGETDQTDQTADADGLGDHQNSETPKTLGDGSDSSPEAASRLLADLDEQELIDALEQGELHSDTVPPAQPPLFLNRASAALGFQQQPPHTSTRLVASAKKRSVFELADYGGGGGDVGQFQGDVNVQHNPLNYTPKDAGWSPGGTNPPRTEGVGGKGPQSATGIC